MANSIPVYAYEFTADFIDNDRRLTFAPRASGQHIHHDQLDGLPVAADAEWTGTVLAGHIVVDGAEVRGSIGGSQMLYLDGHSLGMDALDAVLTAREGIDGMAWESASE